MNHPNLPNHPNLDQAVARLALTSPEDRAGVLNTLLRKVGRDNPDRAALSFNAELITRLRKHNPPVWPVE